MSSSRAGSPRPGRAKLRLRLQPLPRALETAPWSLVGREASATAGSPRDTAGGGGQAGRARSPVTLEVMAGGGGCEHKARAQGPACHRRRAICPAHPSPCLRPWPFLLPPSLPPQSRALPRCIQSLSLWVSDSKDEGRGRTLALCLAAGLVAQPGLHCRLRPQTQWPAVPGAASRQDEPVREATPPGHLNPGRALGPGPSRCGRRSPRARGGAESGCVP